LELFIEFFRIGSEGEALLSMYPACKEISHWLQRHCDAGRGLLDTIDDAPAIAECLR